MRKVAKNQGITNNTSKIISDFTRINAYRMLFIHTQILYMDMNLGEAHISLKQNSSMKPTIDSIVAL